MKPAIILTFFLLIFSVCNSQVQSSSGNAQQDSINKAQAELQKEADKYLDTVTMRTSLKEFREFLYSGVTGKEYNEAPFVSLYNFFMQQKLNAWLNERAKKQAAKPPPKKN